MSGAGGIQQGPVQFTPMDNIKDVKNQFKEKFNFKGVTTQGFKPKEQLEFLNKTGEAIQAWFDEYPAIKNHVNNATRITLKFENEARLILNRSGDKFKGNVLGVYDPGTSIRVAAKQQLFDGKITLGKFNSAEGIMPTLKHEIGHHLVGTRKKFISPAKWKKYYNEKGSKWFEKNISKYAASDVEEGWCEMMGMATHSGGKEYLMGLNDKKLNQFLDILWDNK